MESRNVTLTLQKAKEFYNSGNAALEEVALQAYTKDELTILEWQNIKAFEDACAAIGLPMYKANAYIKAILLKDEAGIGQHIVAIYKLGIIRKALNKGWEPKMAEGSIYYSWVKIHSEAKAAKAAAANGWRFGPTFIADNKRYTLVGGACNYYGSGGLADFGSGFGAVLPSRGLLGCKSREIAEHMSRYFAREIFEACYAQHVGVYEWV